MAEQECEVGSAPGSGVGDVERLEQECEVGSAPGSGVGDVERLDPGALLNSLVGRSGCGGPGALEEK